MPTPSSSSPASSPSTIPPNYYALTSSMAFFCARYLRSAGAAMAPQRMAPAVATDATAATATSSDDLLLRPPPGADDEAVLVVEGAEPSIRTLRGEAEEQRGAERTRGERVTEVAPARVVSRLPTFISFFFFATRLSRLSGLTLSHPLRSSSLVLVDLRGLEPVRRRRRSKLAPVDAPREPRAAVDEPARRRGGGARRRSTSSASTS